MKKDSYNYSIEVLITSMFQTDFSLIKKMNIEGNAIICNQADCWSFDSIRHDSYAVRMITSSTRGKSINQNIGIMLSKNDILVFADDDIVLKKGYEKTILDFFEKHKEADAVKFYCESLNSNRPLSFKMPKKIKKAKKTDMMSAGTPLLAIKKSFIIVFRLIKGFYIGFGDVVFVKKLKFQG